MFCEIPEFGRCCFFMPLRRGVLSFGYLNIVFSIFMIVVYGIAINNDHKVMLVYRGSIASTEAEVCIAIYCVDILLNMILIYGAHKRIVSFVRVFYYYTLCTTVAAVTMEFIALADMGQHIEVICFFLAGTCIHVYMLFLVRSLMNKMDRAGGAYENQMVTLSNGETKAEGNEVYPSTVIPIENA